METISMEEFKKRYGNAGIAQFSQPAQPQQGRSFGNYLKSTISNSFKSGIENIKQGASQVARGKNPLDLIEGVGKAGSGVIESAFSPISPLTRPIGEGVQGVADVISNNPTVQRFANSKVGQATARVAENVQNYANIAGTVGGFMEVPKVKTALRGEPLPEAPAPAMARGYAQGFGDEIGANAGIVDKIRNIKTPDAVKDIVPSSNRIVNSQVAKALNLNEADLRNIHLSTGNDVGEFMAARNLIGNNLDETNKLVKNFYDQNYKQVRSEIGNVPLEYKVSQVPRFKQAVKELYQQTAKTPGLEKDVAELRALYNKKSISLKDVQKTKELMDKHLNLYKNTGDVKEGITKQGLANIRDDIKSFIESEVEKNSGTSIRELNNNVATTRSILDAVETRSTRGLTNYNLTMRDLGLFAGGSLAGTPLLGGALVFGELLMRSPAVRLKIARWLAKLPEAKQLKIKNDLQSGKVPEEFFKMGFVKKKNQEVA